MPPKNDEIKEEKDHDFEENFEKYTQLVLETLNEKILKNIQNFHI